MTFALRPLSLGELLDRTFQIYRQHFVVFVGIAALPALIPACINLLSIQTRAQLSVSTTMVFLAIMLIVGMVAVAISQAATIAAVSEIHLGRSISIGGAFAEARGSILPICVISLVLGLFMMLGFMLLIVPGILMMLRWALVIPVVVIEGLPMNAAMARSSALTEGHRGRVFLIYVLYFIITLVFSALWEVPIGVASVMSRSTGGLSPVWVSVAAQAGTFATQSLVGPLLTISLSLLYYDERVRKEAFDLDHMMARIDQTSGPTPATA